MSAEHLVYILDSFALLAYLGQEAGGARVRDLLLRAEHKQVRLLLSLINLGEVAYIVERQRGLENAQQTLALLQQTAIEVLPADRKTVLAAAHIKANYAISYADAFVAAAAMEHNAPIITGDPEFESLGGLIEISKLT